MRLWKGRSKRMTATEVKEELADPVFPDTIEELVGAIEGTEMASPEYLTAAYAKLRELNAASLNEYNTLMGDFNELMADYEGVVSENETLQSQLLQAEPVTPLAEVLPEPVKEDLESLRGDGYLNLLATLREE